MRWQIRVDRADRDPDAEQLPEQLAHVPPRDPVTRRQRHDRGLQPRPERRLANHPEPRAGPLLASRAPQPMGAMLDIVHDRGRWQLGNLMAPRPVTRDLLAVGELPPAPRTLLRVMVNDLLHLILRQQLPTRAPVTRLTARLALLPVLADQLLRLLPRLRSTLLTRLRSIRRRRRGTVPRTRRSRLASNARNRSSNRNCRSASPIKNSTHASRPES